MQKYSIITPKSLVFSIYNDENRDCNYRDIIHKVIKEYPNLTDEQIDECENYAIDLLIEAENRFQSENVEFFRHTSFKDFEDACQDLVGDVCINKFFRDEMYEFAVESSVFMDAFYAQGGKNVDFGGESFDDYDYDNGMSHREQSDADRSDYANTFSCPIQRAEIRAGA